MPDGVAHSDLNQPVNDWINEWVNEWMSELVSYLSVKVHKYIVEKLNSKVQNLDYGRVLWFERIKGNIISKLKICIEVPNESP